MNRNEQGAARGGVMLNGMGAVITGAASGLGAATARRFSREGARLVLGDIDRERGEALARDLGCVFMPCDVTKEDEIAALVDKCVAEHGALDCMINNAGQLGALGGIADIPLDAWDRTLSILLTSVFLGTKHAARVMKRGGAILNTTSVAGRVPLGPHAYTAAKHGVVGLTLSAASELASDGIRVNAVAPGNVPTRMTELAYGDAEAMKASAKARNPLGTIVTADEVAGTFAWLAGPDGRNVTGQVISIDSGLSDIRLGADYYRKKTEYFGADGVA